MDSKFNFQFKVFENNGHIWFCIGKRVLFYISPDAQMHAPVGVVINSNIPPVFTSSTCQSFNLTSIC